MSSDCDLSIRVSSSVSDVDWNAFALHSTSNGVFQTTFYGDRLIELFGWERLFIEVFDSSSQDVVGSLVIYVVPSESGGSLIRGIVNLVRRVQPRLQWFGQPTILPGRDPLLISRMLIERAGEVCSERSLGGVSASEAAVGVEVPTGWRSTPWGTYHVNVDRSEDELWMSLGKTARKAVRKAEKQSISVRRIADVAELEHYYSFAEDVRAETDKSLLGFTDIETMWRHLRTRGIFETFVAEVDGRYASGLSIWGHGGIITEIGAFVPNWSKDARLNAGDAVKWHIMKWACAREINIYDLAGFNPDPVDEKERLISRFKTKWGGERVDYQYVSIES
jgi:hypothetical protein